MSEPVIMWAVKRPSGFLICDSVKSSEQQSMNFLGGKLAWPSLATDGYRIVKVEVREVGDG